MQVSFCGLDQRRAQTAGYQYTTEQLAQGVPKEAAVRAATEALVREDRPSAMARLDAATTTFGYVTPNRHYDALADSLRTFTAEGNDLYCGIPWPETPCLASDHVYRPPPAPTRAHVPRRTPTPAVRDYAAAADRALSDYALACADGWLAYDAAYSSCPISSVEITDDGVLSGLRRARDAGAKLTATQRREPEALWWSAVLAASLHDKATADSLLTRLAADPLHPAFSARAADLQRWLTVAGGLDCHLPFVEATPTAPAAEGPPQ